MGADRGGALIGTGGEAEGIARVVVKDGQGMAAPGTAGPARFEVHLPQGVGVWVLEALEGARLAGALGRVQPPMAPQDRGEGGDRRQRLNPLAGQQHPQLARAPGGMLCAQGQDGPLDPRGCARRTAVRAPRAVRQARGALGGIPLQPLVGRGGRNPKVAAQRPPIGPRLRRHHHKLGPLLTHRPILKRHVLKPSLPTNVFTMSPNMCS